jgi:CO/xanthine dehydrogenase Mo-binding subunit
MATRHTGIGEATSDITVSADGTITILSAMPDNGTGALTVVVQIVAEEFGVPVERVRLERGDTDALPVDVGSGASRVTNVAGHAAIAACDQLKQQLAPKAAAMLGAADVTWDRDGWVAANGQRLSLEDLATEMIKPGDPAAHAQVTLSQAFNPDHAYCTQAAEVEVDLESGQVTLRRLVTVQDVGAIINPLGHQGQIDGGIIQGFGLALTEQLYLEEGRVTNGHLSEYKLPSIQDVPPVETIHLLSSEGPGPFSARAIGELPYVPTAGAIVNAVADAIGAQLFEIPLTAERVLAAIEGNGARAAVD